MFVIANLLIALASILRIVIVFFEFCIIVSALLSFIMPFQYNRFRGFVDSVANIILNPIRRFIPTVIGNIDL
ncbi:YggT family protein, partial [Petrotoga halophila]